jgi:REP-associated tyrosine transposase
MARLPRLVVPHHPHHIIQSGIDGLTVFKEADDYAACLKCLREAARQFKVAVHAYVLLPSQLQILATPSDQTGLAKMMQWLGRHYVPYFNGKYRRTGALWQGRFRATLIEAEQYFLLCSQYIEASPVRAGLVSSPADYPWSSHLHHIGLKPDALITDHRVYWGLGNTPFDREIAYKTLSDQGLTSATLNALDASIHKGWPLGSEAFKQLLAKQVARPVAPGKRGRPPKNIPGQ